MFVAGRKLVTKQKVGPASSDNDTLPRQGRRMFSRLFADGGTYLRRPRRYFKAFGIPSNLLISRVQSPHACREKKIKGRIEMSKLSSRSLLLASMGLAAAGALARPHVVNAAAKSASVWWAQGFIREEDESFRRMVAEYEKASGNKIDYSVVPFAPLNQKVISALTSGDVPDLISVDGSDRRIVPQNAWLDKLVDMSDVVETQES